MTTKIVPFPVFTRPGEYVAFIHIPVSTREGPAHIFMACDGYSEFAFQLGVEPDDGPANVIQSVNRLLKHPDFVLHMHKGFTLVFERWEELSWQLETVVRPAGGKLLFNKKLHRKIAAPLLASMQDFFNKGK